ncbi:nitroreductase family protein [Gorillibacterium timonense]|uniref:nitroreductase family protein n=1 Tax=Gorillibacterium timonense TaxID=1689269 RepID=UPI00071DE43C|nr:nitroreductase family protein [Gorillibacterium timonense]
MEWQEIVESRYSVRSYDNSKPVESEKLERVLQAALLAPTAANRQPFRVFVIPTADYKDALQAVYPRDWFIEAPYVLAVCSVPGEAWVHRDGKSYSDVDAAIVMDHLVLAATAEGLGTCWVAAFTIEAARSLLGIDRGMEPIAFTPLGYAAGKRTAERTRKSMEERIIRLGNQTKEAAK